MNAFIDIHPKVKHALRKGLPLVGLNSDIITHISYPKNVETILTVEKIIEQNGAIAAIVAVINGRIKVGITPEELTLLGKQQTIFKISKIDLAYTLSKNLDGVTTLSATMLISNMVGIKIISTDGIEGIKNNTHQTYRNSKDLSEFINNQILVVSAGLKPVFNLPLTLKYLETEGVEAIGYQTALFPNFYTRNSNTILPYQLDSAGEIIKLMHTKWHLGLTSGLLLLNPINSINEVNTDDLNEAINSATTSAHTLDIDDNNLTSFILKYLHKDEKLNALDAYISLIYDNAKLAAQIACKFYNL